MIIPIDSKLYMDGDRLVLSWTGMQVDRIAEPAEAEPSSYGAGGSGGSCIVQANCGGTVDLTGHLEEIVCRVVGSAMRRNGMYAPLEE